MSDKESIEIFDKIWHADIINMKEPLYSIALSIAAHWSPSPACGLSTHQSLTEILVQKLKTKWKEELINEIMKGKRDHLSLNNIRDSIQHFRIKYKHSRVILQLLCQIDADFSCNYLKDQVPSHSDESK